MSRSDLYQQTTCHAKERLNQVEGKLGARGLADLIRQLDKEMKGWGMAGVVAFCSANGGQFSHFMLNKQGLWGEKTSPHLDGIASARVSGIVDVEITQGRANLYAARRVAPGILKVSEMLWGEILTGHGEPIVVTDCNHDVDDGCSLSL